MTDDGRDSGIAEHHLVQTLGRRIAVERRPDVAIEQCPDSRQVLREVVHHLERPALYLALAGRFVGVQEKQFAPHLLPQGTQCLIQRIRDEQIDIVGWQSGQSKMTREQRRDEACDDRDYGVTRRQFRQ